jgi:hypothetical protein
MSIINLLLIGGLCAAGAADAPAEPARFVDVTEAVGLGADVIPETVSRLCLADVNDDGWPDAIIDRHRVFLNAADDASPIGRRFVGVPAEETGLREPERSTVTVFADLDNDGLLDALVGEYIDSNNESWQDHGRRTSMQRGLGGGRFAPPELITNARRATLTSMAVGDVDLDGQPDLWLGYWYVQYGASLSGYRNELLIQIPGSQEAGAHQSWRPYRLPHPRQYSNEPVDDSEPVDEELDEAGRPTYGVMIANLDGKGRGELIELNYGRRWNRLYQWHPARPGSPGLEWSNRGPISKFDGDAVRHGKYPQWAVDRMKERRDIDLEDEKPFRANGNTFDCAVDDIDNDGDFDVLLAEITHGWAGESSDRSRVLLNQFAQDAVVRFTTDEKLNLERIPPDKDNWNQGDLFCALADLDHNGRLDIIISSGDYPDDQRLRVFLQRADGTIRDATEALGIDHDGSQQLSLGDVDGDGDLDILTGQTFFRYSAEQKAGRSPHPKLLINEATAGRKSITLRLEGDGESVNRDALGTVVRATLPDGVTMSRQLTGVGGHAGKQMDFIIHFGLGDADRISELIVQWPAANRAEQRFNDVAAGRYRLVVNGELERIED